MTKALFISDLHLNESEQNIAEGFRKFLKERAANADALFILGDLFEYWVGDDDLSDFNRNIICELKSLSETGTSIYIQLGNRDFLLGKDFEKQAGCKLIPDHFIYTHNGEKALLMHGDSLCLDDVEYQEFRKMVRTPEWQKDLLSKSLQERRQLADSIRNESKMRKSNLAENIMDVTEKEVIKQMQDYNVELLIHGHTHRPATHHHLSGTRIVLGDWGKQGWYIEWNDSPAKLHFFDL